LNPYYGQYPDIDPEDLREWCDANGLPYVPPSTPEPRLAPPDLPIEDEDTPFTWWLPGVPLVIVCCECPAQAPPTP